MEIERGELLAHIGARLKTHRRKLGYSRESVAERLGITVRSVAAYERGEREMSMDTAMAFARVYQTTFSEMFDYTNIMNKMMLG